MNVLECIDKILVNSIQIRVVTLKVKFRAITFCFVFVLISISTKVNLKMFKTSQTSWPRYCTICDTSQSLIVIVHIYLVVNYYWVDLNLKKFSSLLGKSRAISFTSESSLLLYYIGRSYNVSNGTVVGRSLCGLTVDFVIVVMGRHYN